MRIIIFCIFLDLNEFFTIKNKVLSAKNQATFVIAIINDNNYH